MILSTDEFISLRRSDDPGMYRRAANEPASLEVWKDVIVRYPEARFWVVQNKTVPVEVLETLVADPDPRVRTMIAMKRRATPALLLALANDGDSGVRKAVAMNEKSPLDILRMLADDPWVEIREVVANRLDG